MKFHILYITALFFLCLYPIIPILAQGPGNALVVNGMSAYVEFSRDYRGITNQVTAEAWIKTTSLANQHFVVKYDRDSENGFQLHILNGRAGFSGRDGSGLYRISGYSDTFVADGKWHHLAGVCTGTEWMIYVDGVLEGELKTNFTQTNLRSNEPLLVGGYFHSTNTWFYNGAIDEVRVWKRALTTDEIRTNMCKSLPGTSPDLVAYFKFDETTGTTVQDYSSYNLHGTFRNINAATARVTSGAAIGDRSVYLYPVNWQGQKVEMVSSNGSKVWVDNVGTTNNPRGIQLYYVGSRPNSNTGLNNPQTVNDYHGVFPALTAAQTYRLNYTGRDGLCSTDFFSRNDNSVLAWTKLNATVNGNTASANTDGTRREFVVQPQILAQLPISGPRSFCTGSSIQLEVTTDLNPTWSTGQQGKKITVNRPGKYWVSATNGICTVTDTAIVEELPAPVVNFGSTITLCPGASANLQAPAGFVTYRWSTGASTAGITITGAGTYWVEVTNTSGCSARGTIEVINAPDPAIPITENQSFAVCPGENIVIKATTQGASYKWSNGSTSSEFTTSSAGVYWVDIEVNGCTYRRNVQVNVVEKLLISGPRTFCAGTSIELEVNTNLNPVWSNGLQGKKIIISQPGKYWVSANSSTCTTSDTIVVVEQPLPVVNLGNTITLCPGMPATIQAPTGYSTYRWSTGATTAGLTVTDAGSYWVEVTNENGCTGRGSIEVSNTPAPAIALADNQRYTVCFGRDAVIDAATPQATYAWSTGSTASSISVSSAGNYWVDILINGCTYRRNVLVEAEECPFIPNIITPNGDGLNDTFTLKGLDPANDLQLEIYNRWGKQVYKSGNYKHDWSASEVTAGLYYYYLKSSQSSREYKGWFEVVK